MSRWWLNDCTVVQARILRNAGMDYVSIHCSLLFRAKKEQQPTTKYVEKQTEVYAGNNQC